MQKNNNIILRITTVLGIIAGVVYWPQSGIFDVVFFEWAVLSIWASTIFLLSSVLLIFSFLSFRFKKAVNVVFLTIMLLLNYVALFFYFVGNLEMFVSRSNSGESLLANVIGLLVHALMIAMISISMFKLRTLPIDRTNKKFILRRIIIAIPIVLLVGGFITAGYFVYSYSINRVEIDQYFIDKTPDTPIGVAKYGTYADTPTTENISESSDLIIQGRVVWIGDSYRQEHGMVVYNVEIMPSRVFKNSANVVADNSINIIAYGGIVDGVYSYAPQDANFVNQEEVIVFLSKGEQDYYVAYDAYGKLTITDGKVRGISHENGLVDMTLERYIKKLEKILKSK
jgi:hypothetical protein